ncbi:hypothetical protein, variant [Salpingoeca rosetta]|uniref:EGF-like domain-containing protein n=1 Tax=Salpingoeca rosetta (strain ATCC 50818 / BSB-021) TaxID=946362 RepID=F2UJK9_SALR5|nr:hypothetical protein, variant [Salpingoeca rosetta]EGD77307.1 hypothetical protein, variant [Salpingoeca rosetta]|eukprot:XP_004990651.1 hypothetical protein, variant [Salpingoeca rosetta]
MYTKPHTPIFHLTGFASVHDNGREDRRWQVYTCKVDCDRNNGYVPSGKAECTRVTCGALSLAHGTLSGTCNGNFGDKCTYQSCDSGFQLSASGTVGARECVVSGYSGSWTGSARTCDDINECLTGAHDCVSPAVCVNDVGSFHCDCPYGSLDGTGKACDANSPSASVSSTATSLTLTVTGASSFPKYEVSIGEWPLDLTQPTVLSNYPVRMNSPLTRLDFNNLNSGRRFQITITPLDNNDNLVSASRYQGGNTDGSISTHCGCMSSDRTGAPTALALEQSYGKVLFSWTDQSYCESGFSFFRDNVGLSANYDVTSSQACGGQHEPTDVFDDLAVQKDDVYAGVEGTGFFGLPEGTVFVPADIDSTATRFAYPVELLETGHFTSTSTSSSTSTTSSTSTSTSSSEMTSTSTSSSTSTETTASTTAGQDVFTTPGIATTTTTTTTTTAAGNGAATTTSTVANEVEYSTGISTKIDRRQECAALCLQRSQWCVGIVVQRTSAGQLVCHQLKLLRYTAISANDASADSYDIVTVSGTNVQGSYLFGGSKDDCMQACSADADCKMVYVGKGFCATANSMTSTTTNPTTYHENILPAYFRRYIGTAPGSTRQYCVVATNPLGYSSSSYASAETCQGLTIQWEAVVRGQVKIASNEVRLPVEGVTIEFEIGGVTGTRTTNADGFFDIHVLTDQIVTLRETMTIRFFKSTGNIQHTFSCGGKPCTETTLIVEHLRFDHEVDIRDTTSMPFSGRVTIQGTEHPGLPHGCPLRDAEVCLYDRNQGDYVVGCAITDAKGFYTAQAVLGASVGVSVTFGNSSHSFERVPFVDGTPNAPSGYFIRADPSTGKDVRTAYYDIGENNLWEGVDFRDVTTDTATVDVAGGKCNLTLGRATIEFRYDSCPTWVRTESVVDRITKWRLPAQLITVRFQRLVRAGNVREEITRYFSAALGESRALYADLRDPENKNQTLKTTRFEYHPPPKLEVSFTGEQSQTCTYSDGRPYRVITQNTQSQVTIKVMEDYGTGVGMCDIVPGVIQVENQLGESPDTVAVLNKTMPGLTNSQLNMLKRCYYPCELPVVMDSTSTASGTVVSNSRAEFTMLTGMPQTNPGALDSDHPHTKLFRATMHNKPYDPVTESLYVIVTGELAQGTGASIPFPRYKPLLVVQDPPGGLSSATYANTYANYRIESNEYESYGGFFLGLEVTPFRVDAELDLCVGLGAASCINLLTAKTAPVTIMAETTNLFGTKDGNDNYETDKVWSFGLDVSTSKAAVLAGERSDMFLVPALNVMFLDTDIVEFDAATCDVTLRTETMWSLAPGANDEVMSWLSAYEIETKEIPDLRARLANANANNDTAEQKAELQNAINEWEANLQRNRDVRQMAATGMLDTVQQLWSTDSFTLSGKNNVNGQLNKGVALAPHDLIDKALGLNGTGVTDAQKAALRAINTIKFSGGGSTYTFEYDASTDKSVTDGTMSKHEFRGGAAVSFDVSSGGIGASFKITPLGLFRSSSAHEVQEGYKKDEHIEFTLGDPDPFDVFDVQVFKHPDFNTLVFHTTSGQSSCPHEFNTLALEQPGMTILRRPEAPVLPNEPAVFEIVLRNDADYTTYMQLYTVNSQNQDGLEITVDGQWLVDPIDFVSFAPGAKHITLVMKRGPTAYNYDPVDLWFSSLCEQERLAETGYLSDEAAAQVRVTLDVEFLQPCSPVQLVGKIGEDQTFVVNKATDEQAMRPRQLRIVAFNPDFARRKWTEDDRLVSVQIEYKPRVSNTWLLARDTNGDALEISGLENEYGYVTVWWDVGTLAEGEYELRIRAQCQPSINEVPEGIDEQYSITVAGSVDRTPPQVLGFPEPADGEYEPGDDIAFEFDEPLQCMKPFQFGVRMEVTGVNRVFDSTNMVIVCEGRRITMSLRRGFAWDDVNGRSARVMLTAVEDPYGNSVQQDLTHLFAFADLALDLASVQVSGLRLSVAFQDAYYNSTSPAFASVANTIESDIAASLGISQARVQVVAISPVDQTDYTAGVSVDIHLLPPTVGDLTNRRRAQGDVVTASSLATQFEMLVGMAANTNTSAFSDKELLQYVSQQPNIQLTVVTATSTANTTAAPSFVTVQASSSTKNTDVEIPVYINMVLLIIILVVQLVFFIRCWRKPSASYKMDAERTDAPMPKRPSFEENPALSLSHV